jgi:hypothetical protein
MMRSNTLLGLVPALLLTTAGAALAQDAGQAMFTLDGSGGVQGFNLPSYDNGLGGGPVSGSMFGGMIGGSFSTKVGETDGWGAVLGIKAFAAFGGVGGASTTTHSATGGTFNGLDVGGGTIVLTPLGTLPATSTVTGTSGAFASTTTATGPAYVAAVTPDGSGFEYSVVTSDGTAPNSFSYGGYGSSAGGQFVANGPVDITTSVTRSVFYGGADLTIGLNGAFDPTMNVTVYGGPSIRALGQGNKTTTTFDIAEVPGAGTPFTIPTFSIAVNDNLMSTYLGGVVGGNVAFTTDQGITFTLGAEGGIYTVHSSWEAHDTYSTCCGLTGTPQLAPSPSISVDGPTHTADLGNNVAFAAKSNGSATFAVDDNKTLTIGGSLGYLSYVPTVNRVGGVATFGSGSMITYGITGTLTGHF